MLVLSAVTRLAKTAALGFVSDAKCKPASVLSVYFFTPTPMTFSVLLSVGFLTFGGL